MCLILRKLHDHRRESMSLTSLSCSLGYCAAGIEHLHFLDHVTVYTCKTWDYQMDQLTSSTGLVEAAFLLALGRRWWTDMHLYALDSQKGGITVRAQQHHHVSSTSCWTYRQVQFQVLLRSCLELWSNQLCQHLATQ